MDRFNALDGLGQSQRPFHRCIALNGPAFKEIDEKNWLAMDQFSVTFQDKDGNVIGKRGINLNNAVPLDEIPDGMI